MSVSESIFSGPRTIIPLADVQHIERNWYTDDERKKDNYRGIIVITKNTCWNYEHDCWDNSIYLNRDEADLFLPVWCRYRAEVEA